MTDISLIERYRGALLGLACGDAIGCAVEFYPRGRFTPVTGMIGGGKFRLSPGEWTDDTSMAICLAASLVDCQGHDPYDQMNRYSNWFSTGKPGPKSRPVGVGKTVMKALFKFRQDGNPYAGDNNPRSAGNGALMRQAPVVLAYYPDLDEIQKFTRLTTLTTHAAEYCHLTGAQLSEAIFKALSGAKKLDIEAITPEWQGLSTTPSEQIIGSGYAPESLKAAVWSFLSTESFSDAILAAANLGDDADTTAAICGQIAGAFYGYKSIPQKWLDALFQKNEIMELADALYHFSQNKA